MNLVLNFENLTSKLSFLLITRQWGGNLLIVLKKKIILLGVLKLQNGRKSSFRIFVGIKNI